MNHKLNWFEIILGIWLLVVLFGFLYLLISPPDGQPDSDSIDYKTEYSNLQQECYIMGLNLQAVESNSFYYKQLLQICEGELYFARYNNYTIEYLDIPNSTLKMQVIYGEDIANITIG